MKTWNKILTLLLLLSSLFTTAQTSRYHKMPKSGAQWNEYNYYPPLLPSNTMLVMDGDTIYDGLLYYKLRKIGFQYQPINSYVGAFREDSINRKVYYLHVKDTVEQLLYDFSTNIGDTLKTCNSNFGRIVVSAIDSVLIGKDYRKRWILSGDHTDAVIIEGIGSSYGFSSMLMPTLEGHNHLKCYSEHNETLYPNYNSNQRCTQISSVKLENKTPIFRINPNPSNGVFKFQTQEKQFSITIFTCTGQEVFPGISDSVIDMTSYSKGIYYIRFSAKDQNIIDKMIVQ